MQRLAAASEHLRRISRPQCWAYFAAAFVVAAAAAHAAYHAWSLPVSYRDFVVGNLAWSDAFKGRDHAMIAAFVLVFPLALIAITRAANRLESRSPLAPPLVHGLLCAALVPAAIWAGGLLLTRDDSLFLVYFSGALVVCATAWTAILASRATAFWSGLDVERACASVRAGLCASVLAVAAGAAVALTITRLAPGVHPGGVVLAWSAAGAAVAVTVLATTALSAFAATPQAIEEQLLRIVVAAQLALPLLFLIVLPPPVVDNGVFSYAYPITPAAQAIVAALVIAGYADLVRCARKASRSGSAVAAISPLCLIAVLLFIKAPHVGPPAVDPDDYHFGEVVLPWWSWAKHGLLPYVDYVPPRGLDNYIVGALGSLVSDGTASGLAAAGPYRAGLFLLVAYPALAASIGRWPAFLALLLLPGAQGVTEIDLAIGVALCVFAELVLRVRPQRALAAWLALCPALVLFAPGQGGLFTIATAPLAALLAWRAWVAQRRGLAIVVGGTGAALAAVLIATPLGAMLLAAVRYGMEHSAINTVANATPWRFAFEEMHDANRWLWAGASASWLGVGLVAALMALHALGAESARRARTLAYAIPIFLLTLLYTLHAAGRIDVTMVSRPALASLWAVAFLLPLLVFAARRPARRDEAAVLCVAIAAILAALFVPRLSHTSLLRAVETSAPSGPHVDGAAQGLPRLGAGRIEAEHLARLAGVNRTLNMLLAPGETFLDLTNRAAQYFYFDRPPPIEAGAIYNLYNTPGQLRAVERLARNPPPAVLAQADTIVFDGGPTGYRAPLVYRHVVQNYAPVEIDGRVWLLAPDRLQRAGIAPHDVNEADLELLDRAFRQADVRWLPYSWGRSYDDLRERMRSVATLTPAMRPADAREATYDLMSLRLSGDAAGLLSFSLKCTGENDDRDVAEIAWTTRAQPDFDAVRSVRFNVAAGRFIVPLDAAPRWLLAEDIQKLKIRLVVASACRSLVVNEVVLAQRADVYRMARGAKAWRVSARAGDSAAASVPSRTP